jgi:hypothetical protein
MTVRRESTDSPVPQGKDEKVTYFFDFSVWGASDTIPCTSPDVKVFDTSNGTDATSTILVNGSTQVVNNTEVHFQLQSVTAGIRYRVECKTTISPDIVEAWAYLDGEE